MSMFKNELRLNYLQRRKNLSSEILHNNSLAIANKLLELPIWGNSFFHIFLPIEKQNEIDTQFILTLLQGRDKQIIVPKIGQQNNLISYLLTDGTQFKLNKWEIPEPVDGLEVPNKKIDVVFVPLLAFDLQGHRVGYGKGYYDRFLKKCRSDVLKIGLSLFEAADVIEDINEHDIKLDYCISPDKIYSF